MNEIANENNFIDCMYYNTVAQSEKNNFAFDANQQKKIAIVTTTTLNNIAARTFE